MNTALSNNGLPNKYRKQKNRLLSLKNVTIKNKIKFRLGRRGHPVTYQARGNEQKHSSAKTGWIGNGPSHSVLPSRTTITTNLIPSSRTTGAQEERPTGKLSKVGYCGDAHRWTRQKIGLWNQHIARKFSLLF